MAQDLAARNPAARSPGHRSPDLRSPEPRDWPSSAAEETLANARTLLPLCVGDVVLDLTSGDRRTTFLAASLVGHNGRVLGIEEDLASLASARRAAEVEAQRLGYANVEFVRARCDDLALDPDLLDAWLDAHPVRSADEMTALAREIARLRREAPLIPDQSIDAVITTREFEPAAAAKQRIVAREIARVLRPGGRIVHWNGDLPKSSRPASQDPAS